MLGRPSRTQETLGDVNKKLAVVTGGARGIGFGISRSLASEGYALAIVGRSDESRVTEPLAELRAIAPAASYFQADIGSDADRQRLVNEIYDQMGPVHVLVNNAGIAPANRADLLDATEESYDHVMRVNLRGPYFLTQAIARRMVSDEDAPNRCIVNITSISSTVASPNRGEYCLSKAGLSMMTGLFAVRLAEYGIGVFEIRPGIIRTDMTAGVEDKYDKLIADGLMLQSRWGVPDDVGRATAALVRGDFPYSTGQVIMVDGGMLVDRL